MTSFWERIVDPDRCFVIAEIGVNHNGSPDMARALIDMAATAGADAVKFQTFFAEELVTHSAEQAAYQVDNLGEKTSQYQMLKALELGHEDYRALAGYCAGAGIMFLSTPFSERAADLLDDIGVQGFKVSSGVLTHLPFLRDLGARGKPLVMSTGMGNLAEVEAAMAAIQASGNRQVALLHCVSDYPADPAVCNLRAIETLRTAFGVPVGWSDHTLGEAVSMAAVARGAQLLEKHVTLDCDLPGPDHRASLEPEAFRTMLAGLRQIESALGSGLKQPTGAEQETALLVRRSLTLARDLPRGHVLGAGDVLARRPGTGIAPGAMAEVIGRPLAGDLAGGHVLRWHDLDRSGAG